MAEVSHPPIPPRPLRTDKEKDTKLGKESSSPPKQPIVPPRPIKKPDRSKSPMRDTYSPLNDSPFATPGLVQPAGMYSYGNNSSHSLHVPQSIPMNPTVVMPTIGQEGSEYANIDASAPVELAKPVFKQHLKDDTNGSRPIVKQRFPSSDIWEDAPASVYLSTELTTPDPEDDPDFEPTVTVPQTKLSSPARSLNGGSRRLSRDLNSPAKPHFPSHLREEMVLGRPGMKQRFPSKDIWEDSPDSVHLSAEVSSPAEPEELETKVEDDVPVIPPRPGRNKLTAVKAGFLSDLNSRLGAGPPIPKAAKALDEEEDEKAPLSDARKGRAKGPSRRKPAAEAAAVNTPPQEHPEPKLGMSTVVALWDLSEDGKLSTSQTDQETSLPLSRKTTAADSDVSHELATSRTLSKETSTTEVAARTPLPESEVNSPSPATDAGVKTVDPMAMLTKEADDPKVMVNMAEKAKDMEGQEGSVLAKSST